MVRNLLKNSFGFDASIEHIFFTSNKIKFEKIMERFDNFSNGKMGINLITNNNWKECNCPNDGGTYFVIGTMGIDLGNALIAKFIYPASLTENYTDFPNFKRFSTNLQNFERENICESFSSRHSRKQDRTRSKIRRSIPFRAGRLAKRSQIQNGFVNRGSKKGIRKD